MSETVAELWLVAMEHHINDIIESLHGTLTFQNLKAIVSRIQRLVSESTAADGPSTRDKIIVVVEYIIDRTDTPWLDDDMSDPFMKAMVPSLVDYVIDTNDTVYTDGTTACFWQRCGSALFRC